MSTKRRSVDFEEPANRFKSGYDFEEDFGLIEASFLSQYGIRLRGNPDMQWTEFSNLLAGLLVETPLGQIISLRLETNREAVKGFNSAQKKINREWQLKLANENKGNAKANDKLNDFTEALKKAFSAKSQGGGKSE